MASASLAQDAEYFDLAVDGQLPSVLTAEDTSVPSTAIASPLTGASTSSTDPSTPSTPGGATSSPLASAHLAGSRSVNQTMLQSFEWYCPADHKHWKRLDKAAPALSKMGITSVWIPPACKGFWRESTGYDTYDMYDLGEFDQKGGVETKYGTKGELMQLIDTSEKHGMRTLFDVVVNHKGGADYHEPVNGVRVEDYDRMKEITGHQEHIEAWTGFDYPVRGGKHSTFKWNKSHFSGVDYDEKTKECAVWRLEEVRQELFDWINWLGSVLKLGGLRLDAIKHISKQFQKDFISHIRKTIGPDWFLVGEYWHWDADFMARLIEDYDHQLILYDIPLVFKFRELSEMPNDRLDLRTVFDGTLVSRKPDHAVSFVVNHDTQEGQTSQCLVSPWFIPLAYALILLHARSGTPCIFYGDIYGSFGPQGQREAGVYDLPPYHASIVKMVLARQHYAYGDMSEYFDDALCIGFTRHGEAAHSGGAGVSVVLSALDHESAKRMFVGERHAGERWTDLLGGVRGEVIIEEDGWATFPVSSRSASVWIDVVAEGRDGVDNFALDHDIYGLEQGEDSDSD